GSCREPTPPRVGNNPPSRPPLVQRARTSNGFPDARAVTEMRLEVLARQVAVELPREASRARDQAIEVDARLHTHALEHVHDVFRGDVARGSGRVRAA